MAWSVFCLSKHFKALFLFGSVLTNLLLTNLGLNMSRDSTALLASDCLNEFIKRRV